MSVFSLSEVAKHNTMESAWVAIDGDVYDVTKFIPMHPGGSSLLLQYSGRDVTEDFFDMHRTDVLLKYKRMKIGTVDSVPANHERAVDLLAPGTISQVPYAEISALQGWHSPFWNDDHKHFRQAVRAWIDENIRPDCVRADMAQKPPSIEVFQKLGRAGMLMGFLAPSKDLEEAGKLAGLSLPGGLPWEKYDLYMEQIVHEEFMRLGVPGYTDGFQQGFSIGAPCIVAFGSPQMKRTILPEVLRGDKRICLAITEPFAGSDVANLRTVATKTPCGKFYIVNGTKKWITGGLDSDYFVTAVRTGADGAKGMSLMVIEKGPGLETKIIKTSYSAAAGTAYITFENVKVPVENLLGEENKGFKLVMNNFNHERWMITCQIITCSRLVLTESMLWAKQRKVFGKPLITQPVIMAKLSEMAAQVEAVSSWFDTITYQMQNMDYETQAKQLAGPIGLLKFYSTRVALLCYDHSMQVFGGRAITRSGMGQNVERFGRFVKYCAIYGGSEEIMVSLAAKQMMKKMPLNARL